MLHLLLTEWHSLASTDIILRIVKKIFPDFEFSWLGREMKTNLPLEMNFVHEASNAARIAHNFEPVPNSALYIPKVLSATKRTLVMEYIEGAKIDDREFLAMHAIQRNRVSQELCKIFSEQVYNHGWFHADPHSGLYWSLTSQGFILHYHRKSSHSTIK